MNFVGRRKFSHGYEFTHLMVTVVFCCLESTQEIVYDTWQISGMGTFSQAAAAKPPA